MLTQTFTSQPFLFDLDEEESFGTANYPLAMCVTPDTLLNGFESIYAVFLLNSPVTVPDTSIYQWNGTTGAYITELDPAAGWPNWVLSQGRDGTIWLFDYDTSTATQSYVDPVQGPRPQPGGIANGEVLTYNAVLGTIYPVAFPNVATFDDLKQVHNGKTTLLSQGVDYTYNGDGTVTLQSGSTNITAGSTITADYSYWAWTYTLTFVTQIVTFAIDTATNTLLTGDSASVLHVWNLNQGTKRMDIVIPAQPTCIMVIDQARCYVLTVANILVLVDFSAGRVLSVLKCQTNVPLANFTSIVTAAAWDWIFQRLLLFQYSPPDGTGQNTSYIAGYYPVPVPTGVTKPIPLQPPRQYRQTPVYTRVYGDAGEPFAGAHVTVTPSSGVAAVTGFPALTDIDGECITTISDTGTGSVTLTATATL